jgi:predicted aspartyl protease
MADTGAKRTIIDLELATRAGAVPTNRPGTMHIAGHTLQGQLMRITISVPNSSCTATVKAFVPNAGQPFRKGLILGMDFLQAARMRIDAETGEVYCPEQVERCKRKT